MIYYREVQYWCRHSAVSIGANFFKRNCDIAVVSHGEDIYFWIRTIKRVSWICYFLFENIFFWFGCVVWLFLLGSYKPNLVTVVMNFLELCLQFLIVRKVTYKYVQYGVLYLSLTRHKFTVYDTRIDHHSHQTQKLQWTLLNNTTIFFSSSLSSLMLLFFSQILLLSSKKGSVILFTRNKKMAWYFRYGLGYYPRKCIFV